MRRRGPCWRRRFKSERACSGLQILESVRRLLGPDHPLAVQAMINRANSIAGQRRYAEAERLNLDALALETHARGNRSRAGLILFNLACEAALQRHRDDALRYLGEAEAAGLSPTLVMELDDPDLDSLRGDQAFEALARRLKASRAPDAAPRPRDRASRPRRLGAALRSTRRSATGR